MAHVNIEDLFYEICTGQPRPPCSHSWRHTVYGASDPKRNGTTCVLCGEKIVPNGWRRSKENDEQS